MDEEETPSKRITTGIQPNQHFLDDFLSFSLDLTQDFQEISESIAKSRINQQEGMSKSGNTPLKMQEVMHVANSKGKTQKVDKHKEDKSVDVLTSKKKRKVKEIASTSNKQDKSVDVLISMKKCKVKEIASTSNKEDAQSDSVEQLHFERIEVWGDNVDDALKFGILYYILSEEPISTRIERIDFDLVESGMYMDYPWDNKAFEELTKNIHGKMKRTGKYYRIHGFPIAMQVLFYECCSQITFRNITPTPLEIAIIPLPLEYVQSDTASPSIPPSNIEADDVIQSPDLDDDFQDPPKSINNKGKERVVSNSDILPTKKMVKQSVPTIPKKIPPKFVQDHDIKRPQTRNAPVSPSVKTRCVRHTKQPVVVVVTKPVIK
ncbi:hypothetical protein MTR67_042974 [Solanum verrucosum]|uniref:Ulp1 protease family, C-terminal catalytic domain containing protein n=1 Tax=Solanum verrucosum TaxID=315347 RepID=A0AAF0UQX8_SOLVR|nr:hypothetical protein MTR67_042974 [Solanum verrucosum]